MPEDNSLNQSILNDITLCTFSTSHDMVREVLENWLTFLGGRPKQIICSVSTTNYPPPHSQLQGEGLIDQIAYLEPCNRTPQDIDPDARLAAIKAAKTNWILSVSLDTIPFRKGEENWLDDALSAVEQHKCFGFTGSFNAPDMQPLGDGYSKTQYFSLNFAIFRRTDWLKIIDTYLGSNLDGPLIQNLNLKESNFRFRQEAAVVAFLRENQQYMLVRQETPQWTVFHVNVWGKQLRNVRERYLARKNIHPYLNTGMPEKKRFYPWDRYYGYPKPSLLKRMRIWFGKKRRDILRV
jgi:hypothetical protein